MCGCGGVSLCSNYPNHCFNPHVALHTESQAWRKQAWKMAEWREFCVGSLFCWRLLSYFFTEALQITTVHLLTCYPGLSGPFCVSHSSAGWNSRVSHRTQDILVKGLSHNPGYLFFFFAIFKTCLWWIMLFMNVRDERSPEYPSASFPCHHRFVNVVTGT